MKHLFIALLIAAATFAANAHIVECAFDFDLSPKNSVESVFFDQEDYLWICERMPDPLMPGGSGTETDPYLIATLSNLLWLSMNPDAMDKHFKQIADIDASETITWQNGSGWLPIGSFSGLYDGNNHIIENIYVHRPSQHFAGLFGYVNNGQIMNLGVVNINVTGNQAVGGLAGYITAQTSQTSVISNCYSTGSVKGATFIGGLVGFAFANVSIDQCYSHADVTHLAGIYWEIGWFLQQAGGLVGRLMNNSSISNSFATGNITGENWIGGLVGVIGPLGNVENSYSASAVNGLINVGGLASMLTDEASLANSYSVGFVMGDAYTGGLIGNLDGEVIVTDSYWNTVTSLQEGSAAGEPKNIEEMTSLSTFSSWDFEETWSITDGETYPYLLIQATADEFNYPVTTLPPATFIATPGNGQIMLEWSPPYASEQIAYRLYRDGSMVQQLDHASVSYVDTGLDNFKDYEYQITALYDGDIESQPNTQTIFPTPGFTAGDGTVSNPFLVSNAGQLFTVRLDLSAHYKQTADINLGVAPFNEGAGWLPIGSFFDRFSGSYDGDGYVIRHLTINKHNLSYVGLFGVIENVVLKNIIIDEAEVLAASNIGLLAGLAENSTITHSGTSGNISAMGGTVGGLLGRNLSSTISNSFATASIVSQSLSSGGLCGVVDQNALIENSYAVGEITGIRTVGGLAGNVINNSQIVNSYCISYVNAEQGMGGLIGGSGALEVVNSYWSIDFSGLEASSGGGEGKTIEEMINQSTYIDWDFDNVWAITQGETFPYLQWQVEPEAFNYAPDFYSLTLNVNPAEAGVAEGEGNYPQGGVANIVAIPNEGYGFINWTLPDGSEVSKETQLRYKMAGQNTTLTANFNEISFAGGSGTAADPWQVNTAYHLNNLRYFVGPGHADKHFIQTANIDLGVSPWNDGVGWLPIGYYSTVNEVSIIPFSGNYNGNGHVIERLYINRSDHRAGIALFSVTKNAHIHDLSIVDADISGYSYVAALVGSAEQNSIIEHCYTTGVFSVITQYVGGLASALSTNSKVLNSGSHSFVQNLLPVNTYFTGGLVGGVFSNSEIKYSYSKGTVRGNYGAGGLVGRLTDGTIDQCFSTSNVQSEFWFAGGLVGWNQGNPDPAQIINSYATGNVQSLDRAGGLIGTNFNKSYVENSYSTGHVSGDEYEGGLIGVDIDSDIIHSYWNIETSGQAFSFGGVGKTTDEMIMQSTFTGWDFNNIWDIEEDESYPYLRWQGEPGIHNYPYLHELLLFVQPPHAGTVEGSGGYSEGEQVTITASPNEGYMFVSWTDEHGMPVSNMAHYTFIMPARDKSLIANFDVSTQVIVNATMKISIYPNPFGDQVNISSQQAISRVLVYNIKGQVMRENSFGGINEISLSTGDLAKGIYVFMVENINGERHFSKVIKR